MRSCLPMQVLLGLETVLKRQHRYNCVCGVMLQLMSGKLWYINRGSDDKDVVAEVKKPSGTSGGRQSCEVFLKGNTRCAFACSTWTSLLACCSSLQHLHSRS